MNTELKLLCLQTAIEICRNNTTYKIDERNVHYCYSLDTKSIKQVYEQLIDVIN